MNVKNYSKHLKTFIIGSLFTFMVGCSSVIDIRTTETERTPLILPEIEQIKTEPVKWFIITPENYEEQFATLSEEGYDVVLFGLTDEGYENLSLNVKEFMNYILTQKSIIKAYKDYYEPEEEQEDNSE